ncbi:MAG: EAL domain-containing protein [Lachnospiraceae bacterium]|nr:EAL domain-containing protein [Lachnospiraceae bacterium]
MEDLKYQIDLLTAMNERLMASEHIYRAISEFNGYLYIYKDYRTQTAELIGPWDEAVGEKISTIPYDERYLLNLLHDEDMKAYTESIYEMEHHHETEAKVELRTKTKFNWIEIEAKMVYDEDGSPIEKIIAIRDITKRRSQNDEIAYLAYNDSLTGLYNRNYFVRRLQDMCEQAAVEKVGVELLFLDIDDFKKINDSIGLLFGDELVQGFSLILKEFQSDNMIVGRFGSDVFIIAIYNPHGQRSADHIYKTVRDRLREPYVLTNKTEVHYTVSAGVAEFPEAGKNALDLIKNAEIVLSKAKESGKNRICFFEYEILQDFVKSVSMEQKLKDTIEKEGFVIYFQPQFESETGKLRGAEALLRWPDEHGQFITSPGEFIPIAERNGTIIPIGAWVMKETLKIMNNWRMRFRLPLVVAINISAIQLEKDNFVDYVQSLLQMYEFDPGSLELEITETAFINDYDVVIDRINVLRKLGVKIALDDFGTGFSSLSYLKNMPIDILKIDRTFVDSAITDSSAGIITRAVVDMAGQLGLKTVAEGVETQAQQNFMNTIGCDYIQGYLTGKPMSKTDFEKLIIRQLP